MPILLYLLAFLFQNAGLPKWSSSQIRSQDVHSNGPVLDETILADPEVMFLIAFVSYID